VKLVGRFRFHYQLLIHDHVEPLVRNLMTLVEHRHGELSRNTVLSRDEFALHGHHVDVLEESKTERVVDLEERPDYRTCEPLFEKFVPRHVLKMAR
jgi:hypothetical protein